MISPVKSLRVHTVETVKYLHVLLNSFMFKIWGNQKSIRVFRNQIIGQHIFKCTRSSDMKVIYSSLIDLLYKRDTRICSSRLPSVVRSHCMKCGKWNSQQTVVEGANNTAHYSWKLRQNLCPVSWYICGFWSEITRKMHSTLDFVSRFELPSDTVYFCILSESCRRDHDWNPWNLINQTWKHTVVQIANNNLRNTERTCCL